MGWRKAAFSLIQQIIEFLHEGNKFGLICFHLNLEHEMIHPLPLFWSHCTESIREQVNNNWESPAVHPRHFHNCFHTWTNV